MLLHRSADVRSSCDICDVTFQGRILRVHEEETTHHHEAVAAAQTAQHTSRADSVSTVFSGDSQKGGKTSSLAVAKRGQGNVLRRKRIDGARSPDQKCSTSTQKCSTSTQKYIYLHTNN